MTTKTPLADALEEMQNIETKKLSKLTQEITNKIDDTEAVHEAGRKVQAAVVAVEAAVATLTEAKAHLDGRGPWDNEDGRYYSEEEYM